jgi:hypothetical protein
MGIVARLRWRIAVGSLPLLVVLASAPWIAPRCARCSPAAAVHGLSRETPSLMASGDLRRQHRVRTAALRHPRWRRPRPAAAKLAGRSGGDPARLLAAGAGGRFLGACGAPGNSGGHRARDSVEAEEANGSDADASAETRLILPPCPGFRGHSHSKRVGEALPPLQAGGVFCQRASDDGSLRIVGSAVPDLDRGWVVFPRYFPRYPAFSLSGLQKPWLRGSTEPAGSPARRSRRGPAGEGRSGARSFFSLQVKT